MKQTVCLIHTLLMLTIIQQPAHKKSFLMYCLFVFLLYQRGNLYLLIHPIHPPLLYTKPRIKAHITWLQEGFGTQRRGTEEPQRSVGVCLCELADVLGHSQTFGVGFRFEV